MKPGGSRAKGCAFEREVANLFKEAFPEIDAHRGLQYRDGADAPDVIVPLLWAECKRGKCTYPKKALEQATEANKKVGGRIPVAITKDDRKGVLVTLGVHDFLTIFGPYLKAKR